MADQTYFAQNVVFAGLGDHGLTVPNTPWFAIGGSYPGAFTAWIKLVAIVALLFRQYKDNTVMLRHVSNC